MIWRYVNICRSVLQKFDLIVTKFITSFASFTSLGEFAVATWENLAFILLLNKIKLGALPCRSYFIKQLLNGVRKSSEKLAKSIAFASCFARFS